MTTVNDFVDILRIIREQPEWGEALRSALLSKEVLELPQRLAELAAAFTEFSEAADRRLAALEEGQARLEGRVERLEEGQVRLEGAVSQLQGDVGNIKGTDYEQKVVTNIATYLRHPLDIVRVRVLKAQGVSDNAAFYDAIDAAEAQGVIDSRERTEAGSTDIVVRGRRDSEQSTLLVAVEASVTLGDSDIIRARERADILHRATGEDAVPAVVCAYVDEERARLAEEQNVTLIVVSG